MLGPDTRSPFLNRLIQQTFYGIQEDARDGLLLIDRLSGLLANRDQYAPGQPRVAELNYRNPLFASFVSEIGDSILPQVAALGSIGGLGVLLRSIVGRGPGERAEADLQRARGEVARAVARRIDGETLRRQLLDEEPALSAEALGFTKDEVAAMKRLGDLGFEFETDVQQAADAEQQGNH
jgi:hypothetical protein